MSGAPFSFSPFLSFLCSGPSLPWAERVQALTAVTLWGSAQLCFISWLKPLFKGYHTNLYPDTIHTDKGVKTTRGSCEGRWSLPLSHMQAQTDTHKPPHSPPPTPTHTHKMTNSASAFTKLVGWNTWGTKLAFFVHRLEYFPYTHRSCSHHFLFQMPSPQAMCPVLVTSANLAHKVK